MNNTTPHLKPGSTKWRTTITGSKLAAILGISPYQSPARAWLEMRGDIDPEPTNPAMMRGTIQEASILEWFFTITRPDIEKLADETTFTHPDLEWAAANPDAVANEDGQIVFIEAKSIARDGGTWGTPGTDQVPLYYYTQVIWAMHMTHHDGGHRVRRTYIIKHGPYVDQYDVYPIDYDPMVGQELQARAHEFYLSLSDDDGLPPASEMAGEHKVFAKIHPDIDRDLNWEINPELAAEYIKARQWSKDAEARESRVKAEILRVMGNARSAVCNGHTVAYRRPTRNGVSLYPPQRLPELIELTNPNIETQEEA